MINWQKFRPNAFNILVEINQTKNNFMNDKKK